MACPNDGKPSRNHRDTGPCELCYRRGRRVVLAALRAGRPCPTCGSTHRRDDGRPKCFSHRQAGGACGRSPEPGLEVCTMHGGRNPAAKAVGRQRDTERKATEAVMRKFGDSGTPVTDPIGTLCSIAGRAVRFMELLGNQVDELDKVRGAGERADQIRAEIVLYERSMNRAATIVESLIRMGIAERLVKAEEGQTAAIVAFIDGVLADLGHNPRAPEVAGVVARRLELVS